VAGGRVFWVIRFFNLLSILYIFKMYKVSLTKKAEKNLKSLPPVVSRKFALLLRELKALGPIRANWQNYSKLGVNKYHCHINYNWVACWEETETGVKIEVYYVGSRESAPY